MASHAIPPALAPAKRPGAIELAEWLDRASKQLFLSMVSAAEVRSGVAKAAREVQRPKHQGLAEWWESIEYLYAQRLLPFDLSRAHAAGQILDDARARKPGFENIAIAATAKIHGLTVLTRHAALRTFGVRALDPFVMLPEL
ncbi:PIN domain-containing protein [Tianweitania sp. Rool2]|uniref:PIN domain-containing protein n=1 Tax=Oryzicola mucosus TaxID=2767425 RepID=A0A8J6PRD4_9HYPH|nr:PIN domain-containing protein [Oryzicola mucosus]MBD0416805.1 PIN domain-containing protein [Oryzicola mucosus]